MAQFKRNMVESEINKLLSVEIRKLRDPILEDQIITITKVKLSKDKSFCDVYLTSYNSNITPEIVNAISKGKGILRSKIAKNIRMYKAPELRFYKDKGYEESVKIQKILDKINEGDSSDDK